VINQKSYSAVYDSAFELDETIFIDEIINHTGIENYRVYPGSEGLIEDIEQLIYYQDEPFGSTSQYAQYKVFQLARETGTTVTLDGQGADEELAGYHYFFPVHFAGYLRRLRLVNFISEFNAYRKKTGAKFSTSMLSTMAGLLSHRSMIRLANRYDKGRGISWVNHRIVKNAQSIEAPQYLEFGDWLNRRLYEIFSVSGLPALLRYEDRNSMACSIEARLPFMDHRLVSFLFSLPADQKIRKGMTKHVMRGALKGIVPERIRTRTDKIGFATPENRWFGREPMLSYIKQIINSRKTRNRGLIDCEKFNDLLNANTEGKINGGRAIWRAVNIELWFRKFFD
jgi:asparagine synthase (glutamine-hydrolysing)